MTGQQLLHDLRDQLEANLDTLAPEARKGRERELEDRSLWSGRLRRSA